MKLLMCLLVLVCSSVVASAQVKVTDFDVVTSDGAKLRTSYYSPSKPGPGILLLHQCNMNRKSWNALAEALAERGLHVLTFDYRGYGETPGGGPEGYLSSDIDLAFETLKSKPGVNGKLLAAGGASCGVNNSIQLAKRSGQIKALLLLTGPTTPAGLTFLKEHPELTIFLADESGFDSGIKGTIESSKNHSSKTHDVGKGWHGVLMFDKDPSLLPLMADWVVKVLQ